MRIKVFMINGERNEWNLYTKLKVKSGIIRSIDESMIDSSEYDLVYDDEYDSQSNIDDIFLVIGNYLYEKTNGTAYTAPTDIIRVDGAASVEDGYYFATSIGWQKINFDESKTVRNILAVFNDVNLWRRNFR